MECSRVSGTEFPSLLVIPSVGLVGGIDRDTDRDNVDSFLCIIMSLLVADTSRIYVNEAKGSGAADCELEGGAGEREERKAHLINICSSNLGTTENDKT